MTTTTYIISNRYPNERERAFETADRTIEALGIDLDWRDGAGIYGGDNWDAKICLSRTSLAVVIKVYSGDRHVPDRPFLTILESSDPRSGRSGKEFTTAKQDDRR